MIRLLHWGFVALMLSVTATTAHAQVCKPQASLSKVQAAVKYLRRLSFDLRGRAPSYAELDAVVKRGYVNDATIDAMLNSSRFVTEMREYHKDLLTINITDLRIGTANRTLSYRKVNAAGYLAKSGQTSYLILALASSAQNILRRGANIYCLNEAATYDKVTKQLLCKAKSTGKYIPCTQAYYNLNVLKEKEIYQEGYVMISPYWEKDSTKKVRVCGIAAQTAATGYYKYTDKNKVARSVDYDCSSDHNKFKNGRDFHASACGCGPRLGWCFRGSTTALGANNIYKSMHYDLLSSYMEQTLRFIDTMTTTNRPYTDILTAKDAEYNGPISYFLNNSASQSRLSIPSSTEIPAIKNMSYHLTTTWRKYNRSSRDAGVLTLPFYLLKYASNRGRLHRFYNAFLCKHFTPPSGGLPDPTDKCHSEPNLMQRCGCKHCHTTVEPGASYWGRWQENAWFPILDAPYKDIDPLCQGSKAYAYRHCKTLYLYAPKHDKEKPFKGHLLAHVFANTSMKANVKKGPAALAQVHIQSGEIAQCSVSNMFRWFVGQDLQKEQKTLNTQLIQEFQNTNYSVKKLVRAIVTSKEYRRGYETTSP